MGKGIGLIAAAALSTMAIVGMSPAQTTAAVQQTHVRVAPAQQQQQRAPAQAITARDEIERVDALFVTPLRRRVWDGKNRSSGDRAHKRMKHRRRAGR